MKKPKTIKGWLSIMRMIESIPISHLKGFDELKIDDKEKLKFLSGEISNGIQDISLTEEA